MNDQVPKAFCTAEPSDQTANCGQAPNFRFRRILESFPSNPRGIRWSEISKNALDVAGPWSCRVTEEREDRIAPTHIRNAKLACSRFRPPGAASEENCSRLRPLRRYTARARDVVQRGNAEHHLVRLFGHKSQPLEITPQIRDTCWPPLRRRSRKYDCCEFHAKKRFDRR